MQFYDEIQSELYSASELGLWNTFLFYLLEENMLETGQKQSVRIQISTNLFPTRTVGQKYPLP